MDGLVTDDIGGNCAAALYAAGLPHIWIVRALVGELGLSYDDAERAALHARRLARTGRGQWRAPDSASCARSSASTSLAGIGRANRKP